MGHPIELFGPEYFALLVGDLFVIAVLIAMISNAPAHEVAQTAAAPRNPGQKGVESQAGA